MMREVPIRYDPSDPKYKNPKNSWKVRKGRSHKGETALVVVREHFREKGYTVWVSEPEYPDHEGFILVSYSGKRAQKHRAYKRMMDIFGKTVLEELNREADKVKKENTRSREGGDPDLFVFRGRDAQERFFVEAKNKDSLTEKQRVVFPLIEKYCKCEVLVVRIVPKQR